MKAAHDALSVALVINAGARRAAGRGAIGDDGTTWRVRRRPRAAVVRLS